MKLVNNVVNYWSSFNRELQLIAFITFGFALLAFVLSHSIF